MTMCTVLLLLLCFVVIPGNADPCDFRGRIPAEVQHTPIPYDGTYLHCAKKLIMIGSSYYSFLKCDAGGLWGAPLDLRWIFDYAKIADETSNDMKCVEYCKALGGEGVFKNPGQAMKNIRINNQEHPFFVTENINEVGCNNKTHGLFHNDKLVSNKTARCDLTGWQNEFRDNIAENSKPQYFACKPVNRPQKQYERCDIITGVSSNHQIKEGIKSIISEARFDVTYNCKPVGSTARIINVDSKLYSVLKCSESGWYGLPYNQQIFGSYYLKITDDYSQLTATCVESTAYPEPFPMPPVPLIPSTPPTPSIPLSSPWKDLPPPCYKIRGVSFEQFEGGSNKFFAAFYCKPVGNTSRMFMVDSIRYVYLQCDHYGWYGLPYNQQKYGQHVRRIKDASELTASCVEYCVAQAGEGVKRTTLKNYIPFKSMIPAATQLTSDLYEENINHVECFDQTHGLFFNGMKMNYNYASCNWANWFWYNPFAENSKTHNFECRPDLPSPCYNIEGISSNQLGMIKYTDTRFKPAADFYCELKGKNSKILMTESVHYWHLRCDDSGWSGLPYNMLNSGEELLRIADANTKLTASCVEYCVAKADEAVRISPDYKEKLLTMINGFYTNSNNVGENINQVECYDRTHVLIHNGKQVENNNARCDLRGWYNPVNQKPFAENTKTQNFECRPATVMPSISPIPSMPTTPTMPTMPTKPTIPTMPTIPTLPTMPTMSTMPTTPDSVAEAQSPVVAICASLGAILLLAIIVVAVICILRSSKKKEPENGDTKVDVQMEDRMGSEDHEAESVLSEI